jgi:hypothetical protein
MGTRLSGWLLVTGLFFRYRLRRHRRGLEPL